MLHAPLPALQANLLASHATHSAAQASSPTAVGREHLAGLVDPETIVNKIAALKRSGNPNELEAYRQKLLSDHGQTLLGDYISHPGHSAKRPTLLKLTEFLYPKEFRSATDLSLLVNCGPEVALHYVTRVVQLGGENPHIISDIVHIKTGESFAAALGPEGQREYEVLVSSFDKRQVQARELEIERARTHALIEKLGPAIIGGPSWERSKHRSK